MFLYPYVKIVFVLALYLYLYLSCDELEAHRLTFYPANEAHAARHYMGCDDNGGSGHKPHHVSGRETTCGQQFVTANILYQ